MAQKVVDVDVRLAAAVARKIAPDGVKINVSEVCRELGISRPTFYVYQRRYAEGGLVGVLEPRSRRPKTSPTQTPPAVEELIVRIRKELADDGWDCGAISIGTRLPARMAADPALADLPVPSRSTIHRVLRRRGQIVDQPRKRPHSADLQRFEYPQPNACWQIDATGWHLADGRPVVIVQVLDDHSRKLLADHVGAGETAEVVWQALTIAMQRHDVPFQVLTDRGSAMLGRPEVLTVVKRNLTALGVRCVSSRGFHPQTCGKNERVHQTLQQWLRARPHAPTVEALQALVDTFELAYNSARPHQAIGMHTPDQRYTASAKLGPGAELDPPPLHVARNTVSRRGTVALAGPWDAHIGRQWEGCTITVLRQGHHVALFHRDAYLLELTINPDRRYQSTGQPNNTSRHQRRPRILGTCQ